MTIREPLIKTESPDWRLGVLGACILIVRLIDWATEIISES